MIDRCTAVIMAGGDSRRMGQDKANLLLGERTLLQSVAATLQPLFTEVIISVRQPRPEIDLPQVCDDPSHSGPLAGLAAGLECATTPWIFVVACDMPFITPAVIELLGRYRSNPPSIPPCQGGSELSSPDKGRLGGVGVSGGGCCQAVVPMVGGYPQALAAFYAKSCLGVVRDILNSNGKHSFRALLDKLQVCYVSEDEMLAVDPQLRSFFDLDTPQDVALAMNQGETR